jgi:sugar lactone lactonase YvrE
MTKELTRIGTTCDILGECPTWSAAEQALYWIDIRLPGLRRWDSSRDDIATWKLPGLVGSFALSAPGRILLALNPLSFFDTVNGALTPLPCSPSLDENMRFNDGKCDRRGRFWVGSMNDVTRAPVGTLYCIESANDCRPVFGGIRVPNGLCWNPTGDIMYFADSDLHAMDAYTLDAASGKVLERRPFSNTVKPAVPDGATVDAEGHVWLAEYGGWRVIRYAPDGRMSRVLKMPVKNPTSCTFGGPDLRTLFITTASQRLTDQEKIDQPLAGALLSIDVGVQGLPDSAFAAGD